MGNLPSRAGLRGWSGQQAFLTRPAAPRALGTACWLCLLQCPEGRPSSGVPARGWAWVGLCPLQLGHLQEAAWPLPSHPFRRAATSHAEGGAALIAAGGGEPEALFSPQWERWLPGGPLPSTHDTKGFPERLHFLFPAYSKPSRGATWEKRGRQRAPNAGGAAGPGGSTPHPAWTPFLLCSCCLFSTEGQLLLGVGVCLPQTWLDLFRGPLSLCSPGCRSPPP